MKSLKAQHHILADAHEQIEILEHGVNHDDAFKLVPFQEKLEAIGLYPLKPTALEIFQVNIGKMCNQVCKHCHVDAGPDRKEIMARETMLQCLTIIKANDSFTTIDLTGGAPEMNPDFRWFVSEIKKVNYKIKIIVRCNLTIIRANKKYYDLPEFYKLHDIEVVSSLPFYSKERTDRQRGDGVFEDSIKAAAARPRRADRARAARERLVPFHNYQPHRWHHQHHRSLHQPADVDGAGDECCGGNDAEFHQQRQRFSFLPLVAKAVK